MIGAPFLRHREPCRRRAEHHHLFDAAILGDGQRIEAEWPAALNQHVLVAGDAAELLVAVHHGAQRARGRGRELRRHGLRHANEGAARREVMILGAAAHHLARVRMAEAGVLVAQRRLPRHPAVIAMAAMRIGRDDAVARFERLIQNIGDGAARLDNGAAGFVAGRVRQFQRLDERLIGPALVAEMAHPAVRIGAAQRRGIDFDQHRARRQVRDRHLPQFGRVAIFGDDGRKHFGHEFISPGRFFDCPRRRGEESGAIRLVIARSEATKQSRTVRPNWIASLRSQ